MENNKNKLKITLFNRPPVTIDKEEWLIIAFLQDKKDGCTRKLTVRQNADGRVIVYGVCKNENEHEERAGKVFEIDPKEELNIPEAIKDVSFLLGFDSNFRQRCIATLPPVKI